MKDRSYQYYEYNNLKLIESIEDMTGEMFHESHEDISQEHEEMHDWTTKNALLRLNNKLCKILDELKAA